jgi:hypothetical protein
MIKVGIERRSRVTLRVEGSTRFLLGLSEVSLTHRCDQGHSNHMTVMFPEANLTNYILST